MAPPPAQQKISRFRNLDSLIKHVARELREALVPGVELSYESDGDARRKFWIKPLKETNLGMAQPFFWPLKTIILNFDYMTHVKKLKWIENELKIYIFFNISSSATLTETFTAKYNGVLPTTT